MVAVVALLAVSLPPDLFVVGEFMAGRAPACDQADCREPAKKEACRDGGALRRAHERPSVRRVWLG